MRYQSEGGGSKGKIWFRPVSLSSLSLSVSLCLSLSLSVSLSLSLSLSDSVSLCKPGLSWRSVDQAGLELTDPPAPASRVLRFSVCAPHPVWAFILINTWGGGGQSEDSV